MSGPSSPEFRLCAVIPTYNNPQTIRGVVEAVRAHVADVIVVDDGSGTIGAAACQALADDGLAQVIVHAVNRGKGGAVKTGLQAAAERGFTHVLQVDGDGQHDVSRAPVFVAAARDNLDAVVLAYPVYDATVPRARLWGRKFTQLWVRLEVGRRHTVTDAMVGFRVYPVAHALAVPCPSERMGFDIEIVVRLAWYGVPVVNLPVPVRYLSAAEGGVSHFRPLRDNLRFAWLHSRLCTLGSMRFFMRLVGLGRRRPALPHRPSP